MDFKFVCDSLDSLMVMHYFGEIDAFTAPQFRDSITDQLDAGHRNFVIDLTGVSFMDSSGLGNLAGRIRDVSEASGKLVFAVSNPTLIRSFTITGLDRMVRMVDECEAAIEILRKQLSS